MEPYTEYNTTIEVIWGRKLTLMTKRTNKRRILERGVGVYEKAVTFDGSHFYSDECKGFSVY